MRRDPDVGSPEARETYARLAADLEQMAAADAESLLGMIASAIFPSGAGTLNQVSWEAEPAGSRANVSASSPEERTLRRLQAAELRYRTLVEQIPAVTFMAVLGEGENEIYVSPHIEALLGFTQREWLENPFLWYSQLHPDDRAMWHEEFARGCRTGGPFRTECRFLARDGRIVWVRGEARLIKDDLGRPLFLQGVAFDITESKQAEAFLLHEAVARTEERYRHLVEQIGAIFWEADLTAPGFTFVSRGAERLLGFPAERWVSEPEFWMSCIHADDRAAVATAWQELRAGRKGGEIEFRATTADGEIRWLRQSAYLPQANDPRLIGVIIDITSRKQVEETIERARQEAEAANRAKDLFLGTVSHELRTPLNVVLGWTQILRTRAGGDQRLQQALAVIDRNARAQAHLIDDLLDVSRIVTGKLVLRAETLDLCQIVSTGVEGVQLAARARRLHLFWHPLPHSAIVSGDADRLRQVVSNLLTNAIKFTPPGGRIEVRLTTADGLARLEIADTGEGIEAELLPHVFDRFRQADASPTRMHGGLGLGLAIVRELVQLHGGRVEAHSPGRGRGTTFVVELPLKVADAQGEVSSDVQPRTADDRLLTGTSVLVVDDETDSRELLLALLRDAGARVTGAASVAEALRLLEGLTPDLVISDIGMPMADGFSLLRQVRSSRHEGVPVLAVTAYAGNEDRSRAEAAGFDAYMGKPFETTELLTVAAALARTGRSRSLPESGS